MTTDQVNKTCTDECYLSLEGARTVIAAACAAETDVIVVENVTYPATIIVDNYLFTYRLSCRKDSVTGEYCAPQVAAWSNQSQLSLDQECSDCWLGGLAIQLASPFGYDQGIADKHAALLANCSSVTAVCYGYTSPTQYALNLTAARSSKPAYIPTILPTAPGTLEGCEYYREYNSYFKEFNSCTKVAYDLDVTTDRLLEWNPSLSSDMSTCALQPGYSYCALKDEDSRIDHFSDPDWDGCLPINATEPETVSNCNCFALTYGSLEGRLLCSWFESDYNLSEGQLTMWNPWLAGDCDTALYANLGPSEMHAVCVGGLEGSLKTVRKSRFVRLIDKNWEPYSQDEDVSVTFDEPLEGDTRDDVGWMNVAFQWVMIVPNAGLRETWGWEMYYMRPPFIVTFI
ncbi:hypothetical protein BJX63DRAFT_433124 [Aspergillus granulosus]|uniref:LysM domain-containing protein n=1 Tax=Aspergillus granulosus TaxID=176169 RepID=A0ABR4H8J7_9EURO